MPKRTYRPSKIARKRRFGFRRRNKRQVKILKRRRSKGRKRLSV